MTHLRHISLFALALGLQGCAWVLGGSGIVGIVMQVSGTASPFTFWEPYICTAGAIGSQGLTYTLISRMSK